MAVGADQKADLGEPRQLAESPHLVGDPSVSFSRRRQALRGGDCEGSPRVGNGQGCTPRGLTRSPAVPPEVALGSRAPVVGKVCPQRL